MKISQKKKAGALNYPYNTINIPTHRPDYEIFSLFPHSKNSLIKYTNPSYEGLLKHRSILCQFTLFSHNVQAPARHQTNAYLAQFTASQLFCLLENLKRKLTTNQPSPNCLAKNNRPSMEYQVQNQHSHYVSPVILSPTTFENLSLKICVADSRNLCFCVIFSSKHTTFGYQK